MEQGVLLGLGGARHELFHGVEVHGEGHRHAIHGEVALEHAAFGAEALQSVAVPVPLGVEELVRGRRPCPLVPAETVVGHSQAAELEKHVGAFGQRIHLSLPAREDPLVLPGEGADAQRHGEMVEHHQRIRAGPRQVDEIPELVVVEPGIKTHPAPAEPAQAGAEGRLGKQIGGRIPGNRHVLPVLVAGAGAGVADALEEVTGQGQVLIESVVQPLGSAQIDVADHAQQRGARVALSPPRGLGQHVPGFAQGSLVFRAVLAIAGIALHKDTADHPVPRLRVGVVILNVVHVTHHFGPQVVVGVDDRAFGIEDGFFDLAQPGDLIVVEDIHAGLLIGRVTWPGRRGDVERAPLRPRRTRRAGFRDAPAPC